MSEEKSVGTKLASHATTLASLRFDNVRSSLLRSTVSRYQKPRLSIQLPSLLFTAAVLISFDYPTRPLLVALAASLLALGTLIGTVIIARRLGLVDMRLRGGQLVLYAATYMLVLATGGLMSPVFLLLVVMGSLFDLPHETPPRPRFVTIAVVSIAALIFWPKEWMGPRLEPLPYMLIIAAIGVSTLITIARGLRTMSDANVEAGQRLERLRAEVLSESTGRAKSLESISSKVAHELKNPLASIKGMAQLLERGIEDERAKTRLQVIVEEASRMEVILADYLSFTRPLEDLRPERVELRALLVDVLSIIEPRATQAKIELSLTQETASLIADPRRIKEAMLNLLSNAIESTPPGGRVGVELKKEETGAAIIVRDTGKGMDGATLDKLGTPFFTTRSGGTGLGVVLTRAAITQHGGDVRWDSKPGEGTTVTVRLPLEPAKGAADGPHTAR